MQIIKLDATPSTNLFLKNLVQSHQVEDLTVVVAKDQTQGRGQMGTTWQTEPFKNLTFSVLKKFDDLEATQAFRINMIVSLAIFEVLQQLNVPRIKIKWPNDILSGNKKICGILIENMVKGQRIQKSIIGIGLNVNQINFNNLPQVSSLKLLLGVYFDLEQVLYKVLSALESKFEFLDSERLPLLYEKRLYRIDEVSTFQVVQTSETFTGIIIGISDDGKLKIKHETEKVESYGFKEIKLRY